MGGGGGVLFQVAALRQISLAGLTASYLCAEEAGQAGAVSSWCLAPPALSVPVNQQTSQDYTRINSSLAPDHPQSETFQRENDGHIKAGIPSPPEL